MNGDIPQNPGLVAPFLQHIGGAQHTAALLHRDQLHRVVVVVLMGHQHQVRLHIIPLPHIGVHVDHGSLLRNEAKTSMSLIQQFGHCHAPFSCEYKKMLLLYNGL